MKSVFQTAVVNCVNGASTFEAVKTNQVHQSQVDPVSGRIDPDTMNLRALVSQTGTLKNGNLIIVDDETVTIVDMMPDSIGVAVSIICRKTTVAGR